MKALVITKEGQGRRRNDFCFANEGEMVTRSLECDGETIDGSCGCRRSVIGTGSAMSSTTMRVAEINLTETYWVEAIQVHLIRNWGMSPSRAQEAAQKEVRILRSVAEKFEVGDILEKRGDVFRRRKAKHQREKVAFM